MKKFLKVGIISWLVYRLLDLLIHMGVFQADYEVLKNIYRSDMMDYMWIFMVGSLFVILAMTGIYGILSEKIENKTGKFGVAMATIIMVPAAFYTYASIELPLLFTLKWFILGFLQILITVAIMGKLHDKK